MNFQASFRAGAARGFDAERKGYYRVVDDARVELELVGEKFRRRDAAGASGIIYGCIRASGSNWKVARRRREYILHTRLIEGGRRGKMTDCERCAEDN